MVTGYVQVRCLLPKHVTAAPKAIGGNPHETLNMRIPEKNH